METQTEERNNLQQSDLGESILQQRYGEVAIDIWRIAFNKYREGATSDEAKVYARVVARRQATHWGLTRDQIEWAYRMAFVFYPKEDRH